MKGNITKEQAFNSMLSGNKVTREYFSKDEYLHMKDGNITSEDGYNFQEWWEKIEPTIPQSTDTPWRIWETNQ